MDHASIVLAGCDHCSLGAEGVSVAGVGEEGGSGEGVNSILHVEWDEAFAVTA